MARRKAKKRPYQQPPNEVANRKPRQEGAPSRREQRARQQATRGRELDPPSWKRIFKRVPLAMVFFIVLTYLLPPASLVERGASTAERLEAAALVSIWMTIAFIPMSYLMDKLMYRSWQKRIARTAQAESGSTDADDV